MYSGSKIHRKLAYIESAHLRLVDTIVVDDLQSDGWFERMQYDQDGGGGPRNSETLIRMPVVNNVTYTENDLPAPKIKQDAPVDLEDQADSPNNASDDDNDIDADIGADIGEAKQASKRPSKQEAKQARGQARCR